MGCLRNLINAVILSLAVIGFLSLGGKEYVSDIFYDYMLPAIQDVDGRASQVADFSDINEEYQIEQAVALMGFNGVLAEHKSSGQKMVIAESGFANIITAEDIQSENAAEKIKQATDKIKLKVASIEKVDVTGRGEMQVMGQNVPYLIIDTEIKGLPIKNLSGIIGVVQDENNKSKILISLNENGKYSQIITNDFFNKIK
ncbi:MAG: hypothetical protein R3Y28_06455 [Candidatus Gastranaerophilales bacterium]